MQGYVYLFVDEHHIYVGSTNDCAVRERAHRLLLKNGAHENSFLQAAWNKRSEEFQFIVAEVCGLDERFDREQVWMDSLRAAGFKLYNQNPKASNPPVFTGHSTESKRKIGEAARARGAKPPVQIGPKSEQTKAAMSASHKRNGLRPPSNKGKTFSAEVRQRMSEAAKARSLMNPPPSQKGRVPWNKKVA